ncbi:tripartite tricarboxylate transporter substrate binding protein [Roseomonas sp. SSH11]|uniref:Tripartite tricarboxylate transporter substrate binding protein n=1 Tax=Pararoseomonas baculiformis TaxID=2820812 RepID=A0ABS4AFT4_9PROT|nr:tripartite tricarboxylate transporter substrate binding protein [Pararoseomonas baculiformis]MBP0445104.1 tripartite tricarboxylate transporter substrate binding protein [Pararoseomonas baculiformis]
MITRRLALAAPALLIGVSARAADFPDRPPRIVVGFTPGGATDIAMRTIAPKMSSLLGQSIVIDNKPGAGGNIATEAVIRSPADGYTLLLGTIGPMIINPTIYPNLNFDPLADLVPVSTVVQSSTILVVPTQRPWRSVADLIAAAKATPGKLNWGYSGVGTTGQLAAALLNQLAGIETVGVPYRGGAPLMTDLISGRLDFTFSTVPPALPQVEAGKIRALAVPTLSRATFLPEVPTIAESGLPGFNAENYFMLLAPRGTPPAIIARWNAAVGEAVADPEIAAQFRRQGLEGYASTPQFVADYLKSEAERWRPVIAAIGLKAD